ncbi:MAG: hypothetical protein V4558_03710 [Gemmatimonadota bacterium]
MRLPTLRSFYRGLGFVAIALTLAGCDTTLTAGGGHPEFTIAVGTAATAVTQSGSVSTSIKATRLDGLTAAIGYTVTGAPNGLAATIVTTGVADSLTLTMTASATVTPGEYVLVVRATAGDFVHVKAIRVTVIQAVTPPNDNPPAIVFVAVGAHTCAIDVAGKAYCWGYNGNGQLGNNTTSLVNPTPVAVHGGISFKEISVSRVADVSCGLTFAGAAYCWGSNESGQLGDGTKIRRLVPTPVAGGRIFKSLAVGSTHVCAVSIEGTAWCWGTSPAGAFGDGSTGEHLTAVPVLGLTFRNIVAGTDFTCGLTTTNLVYCWGLGPSGQLGNGLATTSTTPVAVSGGRVFRTITAGIQAVCGVDFASAAYCWGLNSFGTLGEGSSETTGGPGKRAEPTAVLGGHAFVDLSVGVQTSCGAEADGKGFCWGYNFGAVGDGTDEHRSTPTAIVGALAFRSVVAGSGFSCGLTAGNAVYCWGDNTSGSLGNGTTAPTKVPVAVRWP